MLQAHAGMAITDAQFGALVGDLLTALDTLSVPYTPDFSGGLPADTLMLALAGMQGDIVEDPAGDTVYFNQLGGHAAVTTVVQAFLTNVAADTRINGRFAATDLALLEHNVIDQVCQATGGACTYTGLSMLDAHAGLCINQTEWDAFIEDFLTTLDQLTIPYSPTFDGTQIADTLILALAGMYGDIVEDPDNDGCAPTTYSQLGGQSGVNAVLDEFLANVVANTEINWFFADTDAANLKSQLHDQICEATGGGCTYTGQSMLAAHAGMAITDAQFNALVGDLLTALDTLAVPYTPDFSGGLPADTLMLALAGMQSDIVEDAAGDTVYFNRLGGHAAVTTVVQSFLVNVAADTRINGRFAATDLALLEHNVIDQVCEATGGACTYTGLSMLQAHAGLCINETEWDAFVEDFLTTLTQLSIPYSPTLDGSQLADALVLTLAGMHDDIVEDPDNDGCAP